VSRTENSSDYSFAYLDHKNVPQVIKTVLVTQDYRLRKKIENNINYDTINKSFA